MANKALEASFEQQIKQHELLVYKVCKMYAYNDYDRQDLFQEIVLQLWKSYPQFKQQSKFSTWLYRVAIYTAIAGLRKQTRIIQFTEPERLPNIAVDIGYDKAEDDQLAELYKAVGQLNKIEKAAVMLYLEDKSYEEMEDILGINQANLRVKMTRIKDKLKQLTKH